MEGRELKEGNRKRELRNRIWSALREAGVARFPGAVGRIPNFTGAEAAAERLEELPAFRRARVLKANPDLPQRPVRHRALLAGKRVVLAVPRLASEQPFLLLDPDELSPRDLWRASSIQGAGELGRPIALEEVEPLDLVVSGAVGVASDGARLGKGGGYADLEYALLRDAGRLRPRTPVVTTVHPLQVLRRGRIPMLSHDVSLDVFVTPERTVRCPRIHRRPGRVLWKSLAPEKREAVPVLAGLARSGRGGRRTGGALRG